jgi:hypothetical protein
MSILLFLHITLMILGFLMLGAYAVVCHAAARLANGPAIHTLFRSTGKLTQVGRLFVVAGLVIGLVLAQPYGYGAPWLVMAYVLIIVSMGIGAGVLEPFQKRLLDATDQKTLDRLRESRLPLYAILSKGVLLAAFFWVMFAKP